MYNQKRFAVVLGLIGIQLCLVQGCRKNSHPDSHQPDPSVSSSPSSIPNSSTLPPAGFYNNADGSPLLDVIHGAKETLDIEIYEMSDEDVKYFLRNAMARNVRVRVIKDPAPLGNPCKIFSPIESEDEKKCRDEKALKQEILDHGGSYVPFNKIELCADSRKPCFMHGKMVIADRKTVLVSTGNFNSSNLCNQFWNPSKCNRDFTMIQDDPEVVQTLQTVFENDLLGAKWDLKKLLDEGPRDKLTVSPFSLEPLTQLIQSAKKTIQIENQYLKDARLNRALTDAATRGVQVRATLASVCSFGRPTERETVAARTLFSSLEIGISLRMFPAKFKINAKPGYMHAKAIVVDHEKAWVGSVNGSTSALSNNREFGLFFDRPEWVKALSQVLDSDHFSNDVETWAESLECRKD